MYNWIQKKKLLTIGVFIAIIISVFTSLAWGARGPLVLLLCKFHLFICVFSFDEPRNAEKISFTVAAFVILIFVGGAALTLGRFNDAADFTIMDIVLYYASSNFIKFDNLY